MFDRGVHLDVRKQTRLTSRRVAKLGLIATVQNLDTPLLMKPLIDQPFSLVEVE